MPDPTLAPISPDSNQSPLSLSPSSSGDHARRRRRRAIQKRNERISRHVFSFINLTVVITPSPRVAFSVSVDVNQTVDFLSQLIEAEYFFRCRHMLKKTKPKKGAQHHARHHSHPISGESAWTPAAASGTGQKGGRKPSQGELAHREGGKKQHIGLLSRPSTLTAGDTDDSEGKLTSFETDEKRTLLGHRSRGTSSGFMKDKWKSGPNSASPGHPIPSEPAVQETADQPSKNSFASSGGEPNGGEHPGYMPLAVGLVCDSSFLPLDFDAVIGDVLGLWDVVYVVNTYDGKGECHTPDLSKSYLQLDAVEWPSVPFNPFLTNQIAIKHLLLFSIWEFAVENVLFWLDIEVLFSTPKSTPLLSEYIYYMYIAANAPLRITISEDIRQDIISHFEAEPGSVDLSLFDEAQDQVLTLIQCHVLPRFKASQCGEALEDTKKRHKAEYDEAKLKGSIGTYFPFDLDNVERVCKNFRNIKNAGASVTSRSSGRRRRPERHRSLSASTKQLFQWCEESHGCQEGQEKQNQRKRLLTFSEIRDELLISGLRRYDTVAETMLGNEAANYFSKKQTAQDSQKRRKVLKEKKLRKFFGSPVPSHGIPWDDEDEDGPFPVHSGWTKIGDAGIYDAERVSTLLSVPGSLSGITPTSGAEHQPKLRKAEKLKEFFGNQIPQQQLADQRLLVGEHSPSLANLYGHCESDMASPKNNAPVVPRLALEQTNELSRAEKRELNKRSKKLRNMLGDPLNDEETDHLKQQVMGRRPPALRVGEHDRMNLESRAQSSEGAAMRRDCTRLHRARSLSLDSASPARHSGAYEAYDLSPSTPASPRSPVISSDFPSLPCLTPLSPESKRHRRRRMEKLQAFMGECIPEEAVLNRPYNQAVKTPSRGSSKRPNETKRQQIKRTQKLEKMFGIAPPQDMVDRGAVSHQRSILSLRAVFCDKDRMAELLEVISRDDESSFSASGPHPPYESLDSSDGEDNKGERKRRLQKIHRFFGEHVTDPALLVEQRLFKPLEKSIEENVLETEQRDALKKDLALLRTQARSSLISMELPWNG